MAVTAAEGIALTIGGAAIGVLGTFVVQAIQKSGVRPHLTWHKHHKEAPTYLPPSAFDERSRGSASRSSSKKKRRGGKKGKRK